MTPERSFIPREVLSLAAFLAAQIQIRSRLNCGKDYIDIEVQKYVPIMRDWAYCTVGVSVDFIVYSKHCHYDVLSKILGEVRALIKERTRDI